MAANGKSVKYEYVADVYSVHYESNAKANDGLAARAAEGWELFSVTPCWLASPNEANSREIQNMFVYRRAV